MKNNIFFAIIAAVALSSCSPAPEGAVLKYNNDAPIYPDYIDVTIPATIAPLNFSYMVPVKGNAITTFSAGDKSFSVRGRKVRIPIRKWRDLLAAAKGGDVNVYSSVLDTAWRIHVSDDEIDYGLDYRLIEPSYEIYSKMGIYERDLSSFTQTALIENTEFFGCCNCHSHKRGDPANMSLHIRGLHGCTIILQDGKMNAYSTKTDSTMSNCVYTYWHPSGKYIAYSTNKTNQGFHAQANKVLEVIDKDGDLVILDTSNDELVLSSSIMQDRVIESFPSFSPDGKYLYFMRYAIPDKKNEIFDIRYSLCRVSFDEATGRAGDDLEVLVDADSIKQGVCFPKPSYDGKYIMYVRSDYGIFSSWHHESEMYLLNLETGEDRCLDEINSSDSEGCHNWSSNSRWFVFGSRRDDGLFTRAYIAHFDPETGRCGKPFMLPQSDPEKYYSRLFFSFNIPEFVTAPSLLKHDSVQRAIDDTDNRIQFGYRK